MFRNFLKNSRGNVAILTAFSIVPIIFAFGMGVDYTLAEHYKSQLNGIADAASLAAVSPTAVAGTVSNAQTIGNDMFVAQANQIGNVTIKSVNVVVNKTVNGTNANQTATVSWSATSKTIFGGIIKLDNWQLSGTSTSTSAAPLYVNISVIVDISQSMGLAATQSDMNALYARTQQYNGQANGCVFGCHVAEPGQPYANDYLAHKVGTPITLRIDSAVSAIQNMLSAAQSITNGSKYMKFAIYTMSKDPVTGNLVNTVSSLSNNFSSISSNVSNITLGNNTIAGLGDTDFPDQIAQFANMLPANGNGLTAATPLNYVFIVTDGADDVPGPCVDGHCTAVFNPNLCQSLQQKSTVGVIYTTYLPIYLNNNASQGLDPRYAALVQPYVSQIASNLQACASSQQTYYEASDGPSITTGINKLFNTAIGQAHITN